MKMGNKFTFGMIALILMLFSQSAYAGVSYGSPVDIYDARIDVQVNGSPNTPCGGTPPTAWQTGGFIRSVDLNDDGTNDISVHFRVGSGGLDSWGITTLNDNVWAYVPVLHTTDNTLAKNTPFIETEWSQGFMNHQHTGTPTGFPEWFFVRVQSVSGTFKTYKYRTRNYGGGYLCPSIPFWWGAEATWEYSTIISPPIISYQVYPVTLAEGGRYDITVNAIDNTDDLDNSSDVYYEFNRTFFSGDTEHTFDRLGEVADTGATGGLSFSGQGTHTRNYDLCTEEILRFDSGGNTSWREKDEVVDNLILQVTGTATPDSSIVVYNNPNTRYQWAKKTESSCAIQTNYSSVNSLFCDSDSMSGESICVYDSFKKSTMELDVNSCSGNAQHNFTWDITMSNNDEYCDFFDTPTQAFTELRITNGYQYNVTNNNFKVNETPQGNWRQFVMYIENTLGGFDVETVEFEITDTTSYETCEAQFFCTPFTDCIDVGGGIEIRSRTCTNTNSCQFGEEPDEVQFCNEEDLPPEPEAFLLVPTIQFPESDNTPPNLDSQAITGFGCFTNWYNYSDDKISRMEYYIDGELIESITPAESEPVCEKGVDCAKSRGYVQTWDYLTNYFTEYEDLSASLQVLCYDENNTQYPYNLNITVSDPTNCPDDADTTKKECFAFDEHIGNYWHFATDINARPDGYTRMQRIDLIENEPDKQKFRLTSDVVNYWFDTNDAKNSFGNLNSDSGYQIWKAFDEPQPRSQIYFDMIITDTAPKFVMFMGSSPVLHAEVMLVFFNDNVYYYDGFSLNFMGEYQQGVPYTYEVDIDIPNNRMKVGQRTWDMFAVGESDIYSWRRIGDWETNKIGTLIHSDSGHDNIQYVGFTLMSDSCDVDIDCIDNQLQTKFYGDSAFDRLISTPSFDGDDGWKSPIYASRIPDFVYARYFNDEGRLTGGGGSNFGLMTFAFDPDSEGVFFENDSQLSVNYKVSTSVGCAGSIDRNLTVEIWNITLGDKSVLYNASISGTGELTFEVPSPFNTVYLKTTITGGICLSSRGNIGIDAIEIINNTGSNLGVRTCRNYDYFLETFDDVPPYTEMNESFNQSIDNADFMLEWEGLSQTLGQSMSLDFENERGYCYSEVMIDNIESFENTRPTFDDFTYLDDESSESDIQYDWLRRLGWSQNCEGSSSITGITDNDSYTSTCFDWDICAEYGLNRGHFCVITIQFTIGLELVKEWIFNNFLIFIVLLIMIMAGAYLRHM